MKFKNSRTKAFIMSIFFFLFALLATISFVYGVKYVCSLFEEKKQPVCSVETKEQKLSLTFDIAWGRDNVETILKILDEHNIKATFFLVGSWVDDNEDLVKKIHNAGHEIGNHSNTHPSFTSISDDDIKKEVEVTCEKISDITGEKTTLLRPPFGEVDNKSIKICEKMGYKVVNWSLDSLDWKYIGSINIVNRVVKNVQPGSIVLFHANVKDVEGYLEPIIKQIEKDGYDIVPVSDLINNEK